MYNTFQFNLDYIFFVSHLSNQSLLSDGTIGQPNSRIKIVRHFIQYVLKDNTPPIYNQLHTIITTASTEEILSCIKTTVYSYNNYHIELAVLDSEYRGSGVLETKKPIGTIDEYGGRYKDIILPGSTIFDTPEFKKFKRYVLSCKSD